MRSHHLDVVQGRILGHELVVDLPRRGGHFLALVVVASTPPVTYVYVPQIENIGATGVKTRQLI